MEKIRIIKSFFVLSVILFIASILYSFFGNHDPYKYHTGLGSELSISPNDEYIAFSYFQDGNEAIYTASMDGNEVTKVTKGNEGRFHTPRFSADGEKLLFLSKNADGIQTLMLMNHDGGKVQKLTGNELHVTDAVLAPSGDIVYYIAIDAEAVNKAEGETKEGFDLYAQKIDEETEQLTNKDHFSMKDLSIAENGETLYYSLYDNVEQLYAFSLTENKETIVTINGNVDDKYSSILSYDHQYLAYTAVSEESKNSSLFEYELYIKNLATNEISKLTNLQANIQSPAFFHHEHKLAFLKYKNWPAQPEQYQLMTVTVDGGEPTPIDLDLPAPKNNHFFMKAIDFLLSQGAIAVYYVLLLGSLTIWIQLKKGRVFLPAFISIGLAVVLFISSFIVGAMTNPWFGLGLGIIALTTFLCSLFLLLFAFIVKRTIKSQ